MTSSQPVAGRQHDSATLRFCLLSVCLCVVVRSTMSVDTLNVAIFVPVTCDPDDVINATVRKAIDNSTDMLSASSLRLAYHVFDSCDEVTAIASVLNVANSAGYDVIIGPGHRALCEIGARLAAGRRLPIVSWRCPDNVLENRDLYSTFSRTVPSVRYISQAINQTLYYFRWKYIVIITMDTDPHVMLANDLHLTLTMAGFEVVLYQEFSDETTLTEITAFFSRIPSEVKAVFLCMDNDFIRHVMMAVQDGGLLTSSKAYFFLDSVTTLGSFTRLQLPPLMPTATTSGNDSASLIDESLLIVRVHSFDLGRRLDTSFPGGNETLQLLAYDDNLYNAISLAVQATIAASQAGRQMSPAVISTFAQNLTILGLHDQPVRFVSGETSHFLSVWDFVPSSGYYEPAIQIDVSGDVKRFLAIHWPLGAPDPDSCSFELCNDIGPVYILLIVVVTLAVVGGAAAGIGIVVKRRLYLNEMEKGPNKLLLSSDDLVFGIAKSRCLSTRSCYSTTSAHFLDKPELLKGSRRSVSENSTFDEHLEFSDTARYLGDLVFVKELFLKGFELTNKLRSFIKTLRDIRHENINPFIGCYIEPLHTSFVYEYCTRRSLEDILANENISLDWDFKLSLLTDLVRGMKYLHASPIKVHGSLKSGNLVVDSRWVLKITDYGVCGIRDKFGCTKKPKAKDLLWTAPEILRYPDLLQKGTQKGDVYSFSIILQELILRGHPYCMLELDAEEIIKKVRKPPPMCRPSVSQGAAPPQYIQIMKQCWSEMPDMRPTFDHIYNQLKEINKGRKLNIVDTMFKLLEKYSTDLEETVRERTTALEEEKKKTEHLLSQMLPKPVAESLMIGKPVEAEDFDDVTIYFSDIVGFTTISAMSTPLQVVGLLNDLYTMFDTCIDQYDVYKVETIGDAYMVVSGLPVKNGIRHAGEISSMSLDILSVCGQFRIRHMPEVPCRLRIGLHTGGCVAGVVGLRMPRYCLFGDTVNTASRMESSGAAFRIHVSEKTKDRLDVLGGYHLEYRGEIELKGKGMHKTYWLTGKDGFDKPLPEPPPITGGDNHGLDSIVDPRKLKEIAKKASAEEERNTNNNNNVKVKAGQFETANKNPGDDVGSVAEPEAQNDFTVPSNCYVQSPTNRVRSPPVTSSGDVTSPHRNHVVYVNGTVTPPRNDLLCRKSFVKTGSVDGIVRTERGEQPKARRTSSSSDVSIPSKKSLASSESGLTSITPVVIE